MFTDVVIEGICKIANTRIHKQNPMLQKPIEGWMVKEILCAYFDLVNEYKKEMKIGSKGHKPNLSSSKS